jgi:adenylate cyclase
MWQIIINGPGYFDTRYDLPLGTTSLGRAEENEVVLSGDLVSRRHARIQAGLDQLTIEDLSSRNGSEVNGAPLSGQVRLVPGDTVRIGENTLAIRQRTAEETDGDTEVVQVGESGVRRYGRGSVLGEAVLMARDVRESVVLKALDNVLPFEGAPAPAPQDPPVSHEWMVVLYKTAEKLATAHSLQEFVDATVDRLLERVGATTAVVLFREPSGKLAPAAVRHRGELADGEIPVSDAIIESALQKGAALAVMDARGDRAFGRRDSVARFGHSQVLCIPLGSPQAFRGVLYLNRAGPKVREELDRLLDLCTAVGHLLAIGLDRFGPVHKPGEARLREALERFHAPHIVARRAAELARSGAPLTQMEAQPLTILFADLAGFTALTERLGPAGVVPMLEEFYERMTRIVFSFEGTVDKFIGDSVMALFGAPYARPDDPVRAVRAALAMRQEWELVQAQLPPEDRCELKLGLNTGRALAGTVGSAARLDYTALGEAVNVAAWMCACAEPGQILISATTQAAIGSRFDVTPLGQRVLGGRAKAQLFELVDEDVGRHTDPGSR